MMDRPCLVKVCDLWPHQVFEIPVLTHFLLLPVGNFMTVLKNSRKLQFRCICVE